MIRAIMNGCHGVMGHVITDIISKDDAIEIVAGVDMNTENYAGYPVFKSLDECPEADVIIDFSTAKAVDGLLDYCETKKVPVVLCTTGLSEDQLNHVKEASKVDAVLRSANMSIGINLLMKTLKEVAPVLAAAGFDIEILEKHHNRKIDAPSGTAIALADAINESLDNSYHYKYDRSSERVARDPKEIGIQASAAAPSSVSMILCSRAATRSSPSHTPLIPARSSQRELWRLQNSSQESRQDFTIWLMWSVDRG